MVAIAALHIIEELTIVLGSPSALLIRVCISTVLPTRAIQKLHRERMVSERNKGHLGALAILEETAIGLMSKTL